MMRKCELFKLLVACTGIFILTGIANGQTAGDLDLTWGAEGYVLTDHIPNAGEIVFDMITLADDKIITVGYTQESNENVLLVKYNSNGIVDSTFGTNGILTLDVSLGADDEGYTIAEQGDGKLLVVGSTTGASSVDGFVIRLNADGTTDYSFGESGTGVELFNTGNNKLTLASEININADSSLYIGATVTNENADADFAVFKFSKEGLPDKSFASNGSMLFDNEGATDQLTAMFVNAKGNIILGGNSNNGQNNGMIVRTSSFGTIDNLFNQTGMVISENLYINDILETSSGKIVAVGAEGTDPDYDGIILQFNSDGSADSTFSNDGKQISDVGASNGIILRKVTEYDNHIVTTGEAIGASMHAIYAFMLDETGISESKFSGGDVYHTPSIAINTINMSCQGLQSDGKILIGGDVTSQDFTGSNTMIVRLHNLGTVTSVTTQSENIEVNVYPNPVHQSFSIKTEKKIDFIQLYDMQGRVVQTWEGDHESYGLNKNIDPGIYFLKIRASDHTEKAQAVVIK